MKILIVDDEQIMRNGLRVTVDWESYGFQIIDSVANGKKALQVCEEKEIPDIVITDIRMPVMDGLELTRELIHRYPNIKIVIISAYDDFKYAQQAIGLGASEYILKADLDSETLLVTLVKIKEQIERQRSAEKEKKKVGELMGQLQENLLFRLLSTPCYEGDIQKKVNELGMEIRSENLFMIQFWSEKEMGGDVTEDLKSCGLSSGYWILSSKNHRILLTNGDGTEKIKGLAETLERAQQLWGGNICYCGPFNGFGQIYMKNRGIREFMRLYNFYGKKGVFCYDGWMPEIAELNYSKSLSEILLLMEGNHLNEAYRIIREILMDFREKLYDPEELYELVGILYAMIQEKAEEIYRLSSCEERMPHWGEENDMPVKQRIRKYKRLEDLSDDADLFFKRIFAYMEKYLYHYDRIVSQAIRYMNAHLGEEISLQAVADATYCSAPYLSSLFKKETGVNFSEYLVNMRIRRAQNLLISTKLSVSDIAGEVGIYNCSYFIRVFSKVTGVTPVKYRNMKK